MALTATTVLDIVNQTQTITLGNPSQLDQIIYSNNKITFQSTSSFNLVKSDLLLYIQFLSVFNALLFTNFPSINGSINAAYPLSLFTLSSTSVGVTHINYLQTSGSSTALNINYVPISGSASIAVRSSPVILTLQEFFQTINLLTQYAVQVNLN